AVARREQLDLTRQLAHRRRDAERVEAFALVIARTQQCVLPRQAHFLGHPRRRRGQVGHVHRLREEMLGAELHGAERVPDARRPAPVSPVSVLGTALPSSTPPAPTRPRPTHNRRIPLRGRRTNSKNAARLSIVPSARSTSTSSHPSSGATLSRKRRNGGTSSPQFATSTMAAGRSWPTPSTVTRCSGLVTPGSAAKARAM